MLRTTQNNPRQNNRAGFMLAPLLYMLALGGIGAAVMFSGYSQVLRSNAEMTSVNAVRQQLSTAAQTLSATSTLTSGNTILTPPSVTAFAAVTDTARFPTSHTTVNATGTPTAYGVLDTASGVRQLDPWGKYYLYCKWDSAIATGTNPSISIISAGPDGALQSKCGDNAAVGDDRINKLSVAEAINRANVWQVNSSSQVQFGNTAGAVKVDSGGNMNVDSMAVGSGATATSGNVYANGNVRGATMTSAGALTAGSLSTGGTLSAGSTTVGTLSAGATSVSSLTSAGAISGGATTVSSLTSSGGVSATGTISSSTSITSSGTIAATGTLSSVTAITSGGTISATGAASFGSLTLGTDLAITQGGTGASDAATARTNLGLGTMATQNSSAVSITGGTISGVTFSGSGGGISAGTIPISSLAGYPGSSAVYLRGDGAWAAITTSQWTTSGANIYYNTGNVGIGNTGPGYKLDVTGQINANSSSGSGGYVSSGNYGGTGSAAYFPSGIWSNGASAWMYGTIYTNGQIYDTAVGTIRDAGGGWVRTYGGTGWYNGTYGGGWHMSDATWLRTYGSKPIYSSNGFDTGAASAVSCSGGLGGGYTFRVCGTQQVTGALTVSSTLTTGKIYLTGPASDWAMQVNWGPGSVDGYGILVGTGAGKYSQFQNAEGYYSLLAYSSWGIYSNGNAGAANFYHVSDRRLKDNIKQSAGLDIMMKLKGVSFTWKKDGTKSDGVIAQEIEEVMPEAVTTDPQGFKIVNYDVMFAPIIESIKELKNMLDKMGEKLAQLFTRTDAHDLELKALREEMKKLQVDFTNYKAAHP